MLEGDNIPTHADPYDGNAWRQVAEERDRLLRLYEVELDGAEVRAERAEARIRELEARLHNWAELGEALAAQVVELRGDE